ncbi:MAG: hypothetical protein LUD47_07845 [Clostridia bacterium]|nr:hypothetical protein [Clostridia bacterium]
MEKKEERINAHREWLATSPYVGHRHIRQHEHFETREECEKYLSETLGIPVEYHPALTAEQCNRINDTVISMHENYDIAPKKVEVDDHPGIHYFMDTLYVGDCMGDDAKYWAKTHYCVKGKEIESATAFALGCMLIDNINHHSSGIKQHKLDYVYHVAPTQIAGGNQEDKEFLKTLSGMGRDYHWFLGECLAKMTMGEKISKNAFFKVKYFTDMVTKDVDELIKKGEEEWREAHRY